jgi:hypothetical protein
LIMSKSKKTKVTSKPPRGVLDAAETDLLIDPDASSPDDDPPAADSETIAVNGDEPVNGNGNEDAEPTHAQRKSDKKRPRSRRSESDPDLVSGLDDDGDGDGDQEHPAKRKKGNNEKKHKKEKKSKGKKHKKKYRRKHKKHRRSRSSSSSSESESETSESSFSSESESESESSYDDDDEDCSDGEFSEKTPEAEDDEDDGESRSEMEAESYDDEDDVNQSDLDMFADPEVRLAGIRDATARKKRRNLRYGKRKCRLIDDMTGGGDRAEMVEVDSAEIKRARGVAEKKRALFANRSRDGKSSGPLNRSHQRVSEVVDKIARQENAKLDKVELKIERARGRTSTAVSGLVSARRTDSKKNRERRASRGSSGDSGDPPSGSQAKGQKKSPASNGVVVPGAPVVPKRPPPISLPGRLKLANIPDHLLAAAEHMEMKDFAFFDAQHMPSVDSFPSIMGEFAEDHTLPPKHADHNMAPSVDTVVRAAIGHAVWVAARGVIAPTLDDMFNVVSARTKKVIDGNNHTYLAVCTAGKAWFRQVFSLRDTCAAEVFEDLLSVVSFKYAPFVDVDPVDPVDPVKVCCVTGVTLRRGLRLTLRSRNSRIAPGDPGATEVSVKVYYVMPDAMPALEAIYYVHNWTAIVRYRVMAWSKKNYMQNIHPNVRMCLLTKTRDLYKWADVFAIHYGVYARLVDIARQKAPDGN